MSVGDSMRKLEADLKGQQPIPHPSEQARNIFGPPEKKANYNTYLMIGGYLFFYWLFNHSGKESS